MCAKLKRRSSLRDRCARSLIPARPSSLSPACPRVRLRDLYLALHGGVSWPPSHWESVSQSVSLLERRDSYASHRTRSVQARTRGIISERSFSFPLLPYRSRGWTTARWNHSHRGGGEGAEEDPLLLTSTVTAWNPRFHTRPTDSCALAGNKRSGKRCPLRYLFYLCTVFFFSFLFTIATGKGRSSSSSGVVRATPGTERH